MRNGQYIFDVNMELGGGLKICQVFVISYIFLKIEGDGRRKIGQIFWIVWPKNGLKLYPSHLLETIVSPPTSSQIHFYWKDNKTQST